MLTLPGVKVKRLTKKLSTWLECYLATQKCPLANPEVLIAYQGMAEEHLQNKNC